MKRISLSLLSIAVLCCVGCSSFSMNVQRSTIRSSGDVAVTIYLDGCKTEIVGQRIEDVKKALDKIDIFLKTGQVDQIVPSTLRFELTQILGIEYKILIDDLVIVLSNKYLNVDGTIGEKNVKRLTAFVTGIRTGLDKYALEDRAPDTEVENPELKTKKVIVRQ